MARTRIGLWLIGAKGGVATTALVGLTALKKGLIGPAGLVSQLPQFRSLELADWKDFVIGGHDIRPGRLYDEAARMHSESRAIDPEILARCKADLEKIEKNLRPGVLLNVGPTIEKFADPELRKQRETPRAAIERIQADLKAFIAAHKLAHLIVVNVASTEPSVDAAGLPQRWAELNRLLDKPQKCALPASSLYAVAALDLGCSYINFTPSLGASPVAIGELALDRQTRHMGYDGKTGETLLKSTLAPMFAHRNLEVMSWVGHNIFGNLDGKVLDDPANKKSKVTSKDRLLRLILGYSPQTLVTIEYIASLGDWKTAWDHVHFKGFLGTPMTFQFIWQGCDSLLAAPLVLDLARFTERAWRNGDMGTLGFLSSFFKSPLGCEENDFGRQFQMLEAWAASTAARAHAT
ncbi:MAG: inositol-3-phosphate synthase [Planctomycetia bacterium]|nr:inositol-3-phosphate synthase [Planctomycetia bacterium]